MKFIRHPKGYRQAIRNNARKGAVPPTAWDDIGNTVYSRLYDYLARVSTLPLSVVLEKTKKKFPRAKESDVREGPLDASKRRL